MPHLNPVLGVVAAVLCIAALPNAAASDVCAALPAMPVATAASPFGALRALDDAALATRRGGTEVFNEMKLRGVVADNQASNLSTGSNLISDGAFSGATGFPMVIQNTGNNVLIQSATIINVQVN
jgi:hypothetical protein